MRKHYKTLMKMRVKEQAPEKKEGDHSGRPTWFERVEQAAERLDREDEPTDILFKNGVNESCDQDAPRGRRREQREP